MTTPTPLGHVAIPIQRNTAGLKSSTSLYANVIRDGSMEMTILQEERPSWRRCLEFIAFVLYPFPCMWSLISLSLLWCAGCVWVAADIHFPWAIWLIFCLVVGLFLKGNVQYLSEVFIELEPPDSENRIPSFEEAVVVHYETLNVFTHALLRRYQREQASFAPVRTFFDAQRQVTAATWQNTLHRFESEACSFRVKPVWLVVPPLPGLWQVLRSGFPASRLYFVKSPGGVLIDPQTKNSPIGMLEYFNALQRLKKYADTVADRGIGNYDSNDVESGAL